MKRIVSLIVTLLFIASAYSETLPVEEIVNIPATFTDFTGRSYDDCPNASDWCLYYENVFGTVYHPELDENGNLVDNYNDRQTGVLLFGGIAIHYLSSRNHKYCE